MASALIGYTGFVGSNLVHAGTFDARYNSKNFRDLADKSFDFLICAGVPAVKWLANQQPENDWKKIQELIDVLATTNVREFILISTIDVYSDPSAGGDEDSMINPNANNPYGRHRYQLEQWVTEQFPICRIVRLPALFGPNLRKNALYDLIHDNGVSAINPASWYQWYPVSRLWSDLMLVRTHDLELVNLFTEPIRTSCIIERFFQNAQVGPEKTPAPRYCMSTKHARIFGGRTKFILTAEECLAKIGNFVITQRGVK